MEGQRKRRETFELETLVEEGDEKEGRREDESEFVLSLELTITGQDIDILIRKVFVVPELIPIRACDQLRGIF